MIDAIKNELLKAHTNDAQARAHRRQAGLLLARLREQEPRRWLELAALDARTVELLIEMAVDAREYQRGV